jgi:hypothetical protein
VSEATLIRGGEYGDYWVVDDRQATADYPEVLGSGLPVFGPATIAKMRLMPSDSIREFFTVKRVFPMATIEEVFDTEQMDHGRWVLIRSEADQALKDAEAY